MKPSRSYLLAVLAIFYLVIRFIWTQRLDGLGTYGPYIFEVICVAIATILVGKQALTTLKLEKSVSYGMLVSFVLGFAVFKLAVTAGVPIPFDMHGGEILVLLLIVAPILEEAIFRFMLWQPIQLLTGRKSLALVVTSLLFAYSHFHSIWFVPPVIHNFIIYQTVYTLFLGLACGYYVFRYSSVLCATLIHFGFNLGFYAASLV